MDKDFRSIKNNLMKNEYPLAFIDKCIRKFLNQKFAPKRPPAQTQSKPSRQLFVTLPYLGNISLQIEKELLYFTRRHLPECRLRFIHITNKLKQIFHIKDPQRPLLRSNVVYRLNCSCGSFYIGQTRRNLIKRLEEHQTSPTSEVNNHLQANSTHTVDFNNPQILSYSQDKYKLLILESLYIQELNPDINIDSTSFPLRLFNT